MKYRLLLAQWMVLATAMAAPQPSKPAKPPKPEGNRFLFILETSSGMTRLEHGGRQAVFDLIYSGVDGRMRRGDTYGIWPFNEQVYSGLVPMQTWDPQKRLEQASAVGRYLRTHKYEKEGNLQLLMKQVHAVVRGAQDVNIFVVTDGNTAFAGTLFDHVINAGFETNRMQVQSAKKPLVVTLVARKGAFTAASVTTAGEKIELAELPPVTNAVPEVAEVHAVDSPPGKAAGQVVAQSDLEGEPKTAQTTNAPAIDMSRALIMRGPKVTNPVPATIAATPVATVTSLTQATSTNEAPQVVTATPAPTTPTNEGRITATAQPSSAATTTEVRTATGPEPLPSYVPAQVEVSARTVEPPISVFAPPTGAAALPSLLLILGGVFVGASGVGAFIFLRRVRTAKEPSFISQGLDRR
jgi:hypothetical protein